MNHSEPQLVETPTFLAAAAPCTPPSAAVRSGAQKQLSALGKQAEIATEQVHQAEDALAVKKNLAQATADGKIAKNAAEEARSTVCK